MTAVYPPRQPDEIAADESSPPEHSLDVSDRSHDALRAENERLAQRVADLESTVVEYRAQMSQVLSSLSWRLTSPLRALTSRWRRVKVRARRALKRIRSRRSASQEVLTAGLFPPPIESLPHFSPLQRGFEPNALARPPSADGPLRRGDGEPIVLVVAHVHYPELWGDIDDRLARMPCDFDLIVTVTEGPAEAVIPSVLRRHPRARVDVVTNRGRDWAPLVALANEGALSGYSAIAKVHTKKSEHRIDGDGWRLELLDGIFESPEAIRRVIDLLSEDRTAGLVIPTGHVAGTEHWGSDRALVDMLASRLPMAYDPDQLAFPSGSMFWCRPWLLERLSDLCLTAADFEPEAGQYDATTAHALERMVGVFVQCGAMDVVEAMDVQPRLAKMRRAAPVRPRVLTFFLPQYHPVPENDEFWGHGFTDWVNVAKASPLFDGHVQPVLPADEVGFYDLRDPAILKRQADEARDYGIDGFVFHHYWFDGRQVLERPLRNWLEDPTIDMPLALCWANEPWTRRWDGLDRNVLIPQSFGAAWERRYIADIAPYLRDSRYIRVDGKPLLVIYRADLIPNFVQSIRAMRAEARRAGLGDLTILAVSPSRDFGPLESGALGEVDGVLSFPPGSGVEVESVTSPAALRSVARRDQLLSYESAARIVGDGVFGHESSYRTVFPGWDNTPRRGSDSFVFFGSNPASFRGWLQRVVGVNPAPRSGLVFINAWNEWAEGAAIEKGRRFGGGFLSSVADVLPSRSIND